MLIDYTITFIFSRSRKVKITP
uniref:Uncharacterized protein n=1 Tax=Arundo donax TaxID=35708 RepID=A0A0A9A1M2_ARUDO